LFPKYVVEYPGAVAEMRIGFLGTVNSKCPVARTGVGRLRGRSSFTGCEGADLIGAGWSGQLGSVAGRTSKLPQSNVQFGTVLRTVENLASTFTTERALTKVAPRRLPAG